VTKSDSQSQSQAQAERELQNIRRALDRSAIVAITDRAGRITHVNDKFCEISKYSRDELLGQNHRLINSGYHSPEFFVQMWKAISNGEIWEGEVKNRAKDGSFYWVNTTIVPFLDAKGEPEQYVSIRYEITSRKVAEEQLLIYAEKLERSNRELQDFASVAAHDLQEPLRKIQAFAGRLTTKCQDQLSEEGRDYLERMQSSAHRMQRLIEDLLTFSRVSTRGQPFLRVNLTTIAQEVLSDLEIKIEQSGAKVSIEGLSELDADPVQMRQLLQNLISNAIKFQKPGVTPEVRVTGRPIGRFLELEVSDNGIGFDEKYLDRIFTIFQRLHGRQEYEGTGVGLAVCRRIAERHGGSITARSAPGEGATFVVLLPVHHSHAS